jgi:hypothetical protein
VPFEKVRRLYWLIFFYLVRLISKLTEKGVEVRFHFTVETHGSVLTYLFGRPSLNSTQNFDWICFHQ